MTPQKERRIPIDVTSNKHLELQRARQDRGHTEDGKQPTHTEGLAWPQEHKNRLDITAKREILDPHTWIAVGEIDMHPEHTLGLEPSAFGIKFHPENQTMLLTPEHAHAPNPTIETIAVGPHGSFYVNVKKYRDDSKGNTIPLFIIDKQVYTIQSGERAHGGSTIGPDGCIYYTTQAKFGSVSPEKERYATLHRFFPKTGRKERIELPKHLQGILGTMSLQLTTDMNGVLYMTNQSKIFRINMQTGTIETLMGEIHERPLLAFTDLHINSEGTLTILQNGIITVHPDGHTIDTTLPFPSSEDETYTPYEGFTLPDQSIIAVLEEAIFLDDEGASVERHRDLLHIQTNGHIEELRTETDEEFTHAAPSPDNTYILASTNQGNIYRIDRNTGPQGHALKTAPRRHF